MLWQESSIDHVPNHASWSRSNPSTDDWPDGPIGSDGAHAAQRWDEVRKRLAADLHDEIGSLLTRLDITLRLMADAVDSGPVATYVSEGQSLIDRTMRQTSSIISSLGQPLDVVPDLVRAVREEVDRTFTLIDATATIRTSGTARQLPADAAYAAFRIVQEALTNVLRHAEATQVAVDLRFEPTSLTIVVADNGIGIENAVPSDSRSHYGIDGMRNRLMLLGGSLLIAPNDPVGTCLTATIPLAAAR